MGSLAIKTSRALAPLEPPPLHQQHNQESLKVTLAKPPRRRKKTRCTQCSKNIGVIGFPCRCGGIFCGQHRYANEHKCEFDYKKAGAEDITKNNPRVVGEKIQKI
jgi:predicted nucleic acid binding AN1-type Zn finger protein